MLTLPCLAQATLLSLYPYFCITFTFEGLWELLCVHRLNLCLSASSSPKIFAYLALISHVSEMDNPWAINTVASRLYIAPSLLAPRGMWDGRIDGEAEQLLHVSSLNTWQPHAGRQTCAELTAGWAPLVDIDSSEKCKYQRVWYFPLQSDFLAVSGSNGEFEAPSLVSEQLGRASPLEHNRSTALLWLHCCLWEGNSASGVPPAALLGTSLRFVCPHLDVIQRISPSRSIGQLSCGSFLLTSVQTPAVKVILEPEGVHGHTVVRNALDFVFLSLPLLPLNKSFF